MLWQTVPAIIGIIVYAILRYRCVPWWITLVTGIIIAASAILIEKYYAQINLSHFIHLGGKLNFAWWKIFFSQGIVFQYVFGAPGEIRTPDPLVRSQVLYPTELRAL
jgi:hypothetical protein